VLQSGPGQGTGLTREQARDLLAQPELKTIEGKRDRAILAVLLGCALWRSELAALECAHIQQRDISCDRKWEFDPVGGSNDCVKNASEGGTHSISGAYLYWK
jgi:hypothetical protein